MVIKGFPPIEWADQYGLLAIGGDAAPDSLILAYRNGIFPWEGKPLMWFAPPKRAVLFLDEFKASRSFKRALRDNPFEIQFNSNFRAVMEGCKNSRNRKGKKGTWLTAEMVDGYCGLFDKGNAYCISACLKGKLVGGVYGVIIGEMVTAESMFYKEPDASKICLLHLIEHFRSLGIKWIDCQAANPFTKSFGVREIEREQFMKMLNAAISEI